MPFKAPAPGFVLARFPKDAQIVELGIARELAVRALGLGQDLLQPHDRLRLLVRSGAHPRGHQGVCQFPLPSIHLLER